MSAGVVRWFGLLLLLALVVSTAGPDAAKDPACLLPLPFFLAVVAACLGNREPTPDLVLPLRAQWTISPASPRAPPR
ncbi:MAG: hypothetical protein AB1714_17320 [Acidobacteriota bacterium]